MDTRAQRTKTGGPSRRSGQKGASNTPALDASPEIPDILTDRATQLAMDPASQALFVIGHGPNASVDYADSMRNRERRVEEATWGWTHD